MKKVISLTMVLLVLAGIYLSTAPHVMGWAGDPLTPLFNTHGEMARDALAGSGLGWGYWERGGPQGIPQYADTVDSITILHPEWNCHKVEVYWLSPRLSGGASCGGLGAEWHASDHLVMARQYYAAGCSEYAEQELGYAIHYIQDALCPAHVFPFRTGFTTAASTDFESVYVPLQYELTDWPSKVGNAPITPVLTPAQLRNEIVNAAKWVNTLPCWFRAEDGNYYTSDDDNGDGWYDQVAPWSGREWFMSDGDIGDVMGKAASLVKGAALWATQPGLPPAVGEAETNPTPPSFNSQLFVDCYNSNGGTVRLGDPLNKVHSWGNGWIQDFRGGLAYQGAIMLPYGGNSAYAVYGDIWSKYLSLGGATGSLGYPQTSETTGPQSTLTGALSRYNRFNGGVIVHRKATASVVAKTSFLGWGIYNKWQGLLTGGNNDLGLPVADEYAGARSGASGFTTTGKICDFEGGHLYWYQDSYGDKAFETHGAIDARYMAEQGPASWLGYPTSDEKVDPSNTDDRISEFEGGYICWDRSSDQTSVHTYPTIADLTVTSVNANTSATPGGYIAVSWTVRNNGGTSSGSFWNRIYLGTTRWDIDVALLGSFSMASIGPKLSSSDAQVVQIPSNVPLGNYYVTVYADAQPLPNGVVAEANEMNNIGDTYPMMISIGASSSPPASPSNLLATSVSSNQINLSWQDNSNNETGFRIERKVAGGAYAPINSVGSYTAEYPDGGLLQNTTYYYRVIAYNSSGDSTSYSNEAYATTYPTSLNPPSGLVAAPVSYNQINLSWQDNSGGEIGFKIERSTSGRAYEEIGTAPASTTYYADSGLASDTNYCYRVRAYTDAVYSDYSSAACTGTLTIPLPPANLAANPASKSEIVLTWWDMSFNETEFKIERNTSASGPYVEIGTVGPGVTSYSSSGLDEGTTYFYRVKAHNGEGDSAYCPYAFATTLSSPTIACTPSNLSFQGTAAGTNPSAQTLSIWNAGDEPLNWAVSDDADWLSLIPASGTSTGETDCVAVSADLSGRTPGKYSAKITISASGAINSPRTVSVILTVLAEHDSMTVIRVPQDWPTIGQAISWARLFPLSTVLVSPGTYTEVVRMAENINLIGEDRNSTFIVAPEGSSWAVLGANNARISGFTIQGGFHVINCGLQVSPSSPEISNNIIVVGDGADSIAVGQGSSPLISNNVIYGSIYSNASSPVIRNNIIHNNGHGGGIFLEDGSTATIINNVLEAPVSHFSSGIYFYSNSDRGTIRNNIFVNFFIALNNPYSGGASFSYNAFFNVWYELSEGGYQGPSNHVGDLTVDPLFVNSAAGDYHLSDGSPCMDFGDPSAGFYDTDFPPSKGTQRNDMGAYGGPWAQYHSEPTVSLYSFTGGEEVHVGDHVEIIWGAADDITVTVVEIYYSTNGGSTYPYAIAMAEANDGIYVWTIPDTCSTTCRVKVVAHDNQGNTGQATSATNFTILPRSTPVDGTEFSGVISVDTTWSASGSPYVVTGDITISAGAILTIEPGVTVRIYPNRSLRVDGELVAIGTETDPITFTSDRSVPVPGDWGWILFTDSSIDAAFLYGNYLSGSVLSFCVIEFAGEGDVAAIGIENAAPLIDHCTIRNNLYGGIGVDHGSPLISHNTITMNSGYFGAAIYAIGGDVQIVGNTIDRNYGDGSGGIYIDQGNATIVGNIISNNSTPSSGGGAIGIDNGSAYIAGNVITNNTASVGGAIRAYNSTVVITHNVISGNSALSISAIYGYLGSLTITYNEITGNHESNEEGAIKILAQATVTINNNNIYGNTPYNLKYDGELEIDATNNWWGTADEAAIAALILDQSDHPYLGIVHWQPYLTEEINLADLTPPSAPMVMDGGSYSASLTQLYATWDASDQESGISEYQYAIGTTPWATDIVSWTAVGTDTEALVTGMALVPGTTYYFAVRAMNGAGLWSVVGISDGITVDNTPPSIPLVSDDGDYTWSTSELHATWSASDDESAIAEFQFAIGTAPGLTDVVDWTSAALGTEATVQGLSLSAGGTYYLAVRARNGAGLWSEWGISDGITVDNTPPTAPLVVDDGSYTSSTTELYAIWSASDPESGVVEYRYAIGVSAGSADLVGWTSAGTDTEVAATGLSLSPGITYYFAVQARNGAGLWSDVGTSDGITVGDLTAPDVPTLISPANWKKVNSAYTLDWSDVTDASGVTYQIRLYNSSWSLLKEQTGLTASAYGVSSYGSLADGTYYWRVRAVDGAGNASAWTTSWAFKLDNTLPSMPVHLSPSSWKQINNSATLDWSDVSDASGVTYQIRLYNSSWSLLKEKTGLTSSAYAVSSFGSLADGTYYWRVRTVDGAGNASTWTTSWAFKLDNTLPSVPVHLSPTSWKKINSSATLDWSDVSDASGVTYQIRLYNSSWSLVKEKTGLTSSAYAVSSFGSLANGTYYWRVRAVDGAGNASAWTTSWAFKLDSTLP
jgi:Tfp pilus assembly protein PilX